MLTTNLNLLKGLIIIIYHLGFIIIIFIIIVVITTEFMHNLNWPNSYTDSDRKHKELHYSSAEGWLLYSNIMEFQNIIINKGKEY